LQLAQSRGITRTDSPHKRGHYGEQVIGSFLMWTTVISGFCKLVTMVYSLRAYAYMLPATLTCSLPYIVVQRIHCYRYLVSFLLIFLAFDGAGRHARYTIKPVAGAEPDRFPIPIQLGWHTGATLVRWRRSRKIESRSPLRDGNAHIDAFLVTMHLPCAGDELSQRLAIRKKDFQ
jgi:hypothetical protein